MYLKQQSCCFLHKFRFLLSIFYGLKIMKNPEKVAEKHINFKSNNIPDFG
jgi:hypothetical protein